MTGRRKFLNVLLAFAIAAPVATMGYMISDGLEAAPAASFAIDAPVDDAIVRALGHSVPGIGAGWEGLHDIVPPVLIEPVLDLYQAAHAVELSGDNAHDLAQAGDVIGVLDTARFGWRAFGEANAKFTWPAVQHPDPWTGVGASTYTYVGFLEHERGLDAVPVPTMGAAEAFAAFYAAHGLPDESAQAVAALGGLTPANQAALVAYVAAAAVAAEMIHEATSRLSPAEMAFALDHPQAFFPRSDGTDHSDDAQTLDIIARLDADKVVQAASMLSRATKNAASSFVPAGDQFTDPHGVIEVTGWANDVFAEPRVIRVDLGGNDVALATARPASADTSLGRPVGLHLDLGGDDSYFGRAGDLAGARFGVAFLADLAGDDRYIATSSEAPGAPSFAIAGAHAGIAVLDDFAGNDRYSTDAPGSLGAAVAGLALLRDAEGNDIYKAGGEGAGTVGGIANMGAAAAGFAAVWDREGDDQSTLAFGGPGLPGFNGQSYFMDWQGADLHASLTGPDLSYGAANTNTFLTTFPEADVGLTDTLQPFGLGMAMDIASDMLVNPLEDPTRDSDGDGTPDLVAFNQAMSVSDVNTTSPVVLNGCGDHEDAQNDPANYALCAAFWGLNSGRLDLAGVVTLSSSILGRNTYTTADEPGQILIDLGGNDNYNYRVAAADGPDDVSLVLDIGGSDSYGDGSSDGQLGYGADAGVGILIDTSYPSYLTLLPTNSFNGGDDSAGYGDGGIGIIYSDGPARLCETCSNALNAYNVLNRDAVGIEVEGVQMGIEQRGPMRWWADTDGDTGLGFGWDGSTWTNYDISGNLLDPATYTQNVDRINDLSADVDGPVINTGLANPLVVAPGGEYTLDATISYHGLTRAGSSGPTDGYRFEVTTYQEGEDPALLEPTFQSERFSADPNTEREFNATFNVDGLQFGEGDAYQMDVQGVWANPVNAALETQNDNNIDTLFMSVESVEAAFVSGITAPAGNPAQAPPGHSMTIQAAIATDGNVPMDDVPVEFTITAHEEGSPPTVVLTGTDYVDLMPAGDLDLETPGPSIAAAMEWDVPAIERLYTVQVTVPGTHTRDGEDHTIVINVEVAIVQSLEAELAVPGFVGIEGANAAAPVPITSLIRTLGNVPTDYTATLSIENFDSGDYTEYSWDGIIGQGTDSVHLHTVEWTPAAGGEYEAFLHVDYAPSNGGLPAGVRQEIVVVDGLVTFTGGEGNDGWTVDGNDVANFHWEPMTQVDVPAFGPVHGDHVWGIDLLSGGVRDNTYLVSPPIDLTLRDNPMLHFAYGIEGTTSVGFRVEASTDGNSWTIVEPEGGYPCQTGMWAFDFPDRMGYCNDRVGTATFDLGEYIGEVMQVRFHAAAYWSTFWHPLDGGVDDVYLAAPLRAEVDLSVLDSRINPTNPAPGESISVEALVSNRGLDTETATLDLAFGDSLGGPSILSGQETVTLDPLESQWVSFDAGVVEPGYYRSHMTLDVAGDVLPDNNELVKDLSVTEQLVFDDFEASAGIWEIPEIGGGWQHGAPNEGGGDPAAFSGDNLIGTTFGGIARGNMYLESTAIEVPCLGYSCQGAALEFEHWFDLSFASVQEAHVGISLDGGESWQVIEPEEGYSYYDTFSCPGGCWTNGQTGGWQSVRVPLFDGQFVEPGSTLHIQLAHEGRFDCCQDQGWYLDDFQVHLPPAPRYDLQVEVATGDDYFQDIRGAVALPIKVYNRGLEAMPPTPVTVTVDGDDTFSATRTVPALGPGEVWEDFSSILYTAPLAGDLTVRATLDVVDQLSVDDEDTGIAKIYWIEVDNDLETTGYFVPEGPAWQIGTPLDGPSSGTSGTSVWATNLEGDYPAGMNDALVSPEITLAPQLGDPVFSFQAWHRASSADKLYVQVQEEEFGPWHTLPNQLGASSITGFKAYWTEHQYALDQYIGDTITLRLLATSDSSSQHEGWFIDDVRVYGTVRQQDVAVEILRPTQDIVGPNQPLEVHVLLSNNGLQAADEVEIVTDLLNGREITDVFNLQPFEQRVIVQEFIAAGAEGQTGPLRVKANFEGDQRNSDNTIARTVEIKEVHDLTAVANPTPLGTLNLEPVSIEWGVVNDGTMVRDGTATLTVRERGGPVIVTDTLSANDLTQEESALRVTPFVPMQAAAYEVITTVTPTDAFPTGNEVLETIYIGVPADIENLDFRLESALAEGYRFNDVSGKFRAGPHPGEESIQGLGQLSTLDLGRGETYTATFAVDLTNAIGPELMFLHRYQTMPENGGVIEISTDGHDWNTLTPEGGYPSGNVLSLGGPGFNGEDQPEEGTPVTVDLSDFRGQEVDIRFRYALVEDTPFVALGWRIDAVSVDDGPQNLFGADFELNYLHSYDDASDWTASASSLWENGVPSSGPGEVFEGSGLWGIDLDGDYVNNMDDSLEGPAIFTPGIDSTPRATAAIWYASEGFWDCLQLEARTDGGSWQQIDPEGGYPNSCRSGGRGYSGSSGGWIQPQFVLDNIADQLVEFRWRATSDTSFVGGAGWYVDNFRVGPEELLDAGGEGGAVGGMLSGAYGTPEDLQWGLIESGPHQTSDGIHGWATTLDGKYLAGSDELVVFDALDIGDVRKPTLHASAWVQTFDGDAATMQYSVDNGPWQTAATWSSFEPRVHTANVPLPEGSDQVKARLVWESDAEDEASGVYMESITVSSSNMVLRDLPAVAFDVWDGTEFAVSGLLINRGPYEEAFTISATAPDSRWTIHDEVVTADPGEVVPFTLRVATSYGGSAGLKEIFIEAISNTDPTAVVQEAVPLNFFITPKPDLVVPRSSGALTMDPVYDIGGRDFVFAGSDIELGVLVLNMGNVPYDGGIGITLFDSVDGADPIPVATAPVPPIPVGEPTVIHFTWTPDSPGEHTITPTINAARIVPELRFDNNAMDFDILVRDQPRPDYVVTGVTLDRLDVTDEEAVVVLADISNVGIESTTLPVPVELLVDPVSPTITAPELTVPAGTELTWKMSYALENGIDGVVVEINDGTGWTTLTPAEGYPLHRVTSVDGPAFTGSRITAPYSTLLPGGDVQVRWRLAMDGTNPVSEDILTGFVLDAVEFRAPNDGPVFHQQGFENQAFAELNGWMFEDGIDIAKPALGAPEGQQVARFGGPEGYSNPAFQRALDLRPGPTVGQTTTAALSWTAQSGEHVLRINVDPKNVLYEQGSDLNIGDLVVNVGEVGLDLLIEDDGAVVLPGQTITIDGTLVNSVAQDTPVTVRTQAPGGWDVTLVGATHGVINAPAGTDLPVQFHVTAPSNAAATEEVRLRLNLTVPSSSASLERVIRVEVGATDANLRVDESIAGVGTDGRGEAVIDVTSLSPQTLPVSILPQSPSGWVVTPEPGDFDLAGFDSQSVRLDLLMPASTPAGHYTIPIDVQTGAETWTLPLDVEVTPTHRVKVTMPSDAVAVIGGTTTVPVTITNTGHLPAVLEGGIQAVAPMGVSTSWAAALPTSIGAGETWTGQLTLNATNAAVPGKAPVHVFARSNDAILASGATALTVQVEPAAYLTFVADEGGRPITILDDRGRIKIGAAIQNLGSVASEPMEAVLVVDGTEQARERIAVAPGAVSTIGFAADAGASEVRINIVDSANTTVLSSMWADNANPVDSIDGGKLSSKGAPGPAMVALLGAIVVAFAARRRQ